MSQQNCQKGALGNRRERNLRFSLDNEDASCLTAGRVGHGLRQIFKEPCVLSERPTGAAIHIASGSVWATPQLTAKSPFLRHWRKVSGRQRTRGRGRVRGRSRRDYCIRPLILTFSPEYRGEGTRESASTRVRHMSQSSFPPLSSFWSSLSLV